MLLFVRPPFRFGAPGTVHTSGVPHTWRSEVAKLINLQEIGWCGVTSAGNWRGWLDARGNRQPATARMIEPMPASSAA